jgi:hypothetical protein
MRLVDDWKRVLTRSWAVRFQLFNTFCQGLLWGTGALGLGFSAPMVAGFVVACVLLNSGPILARIVWQKDFHCEDED